MIIMPPNYTEELKRIKQGGHFTSLSRIPYEDYVINGIVIKNNKSYLKHERTIIHTSIRKDIYESFLKLSKRKKKPISKILDCIWITFENNLYIIFILISYIFPYNSVVTDLRLHSLILIIIVIIYNNWYF